MNSTIAIKCVGLLLAAGRGRRMGGNKQFHIVQTPGGEKPLVAAAFDTISRACDTMFVVLGHRAEEVAAALSPREFETVLVDPDAPMIGSVQAGLRMALIPSRRATPSGSCDLPPRPAAFLGLGRPTLPEGRCLLPSLREGRPLRAGEGLSILLQLGDHPVLEPGTLNQLLAAAQQHSDKAIMPTYQGNGGHPVLIPMSVVEQILASPCPDGLRQFWIDHPDLCMRLEVDDPGVVRNVNTL